MELLLEWSGPAIYAAQAVSALFGVFMVILLMRKIAQKRFSSHAAAEQFLGEVRERLQRKDFDGVVEYCDTPAYWSKATPQLVLYALANRDRPLAKLRQLVAERFEREVLAELYYGRSWVATMEKCAPMLGLLGTVTGMIMAFAKIAGAQQTGADPKALSSDISVALYTTMWGLTIAIPLAVLGSMVQVRISRLTDSVQQHVSEFLEDFDAARS